jgi:monovalent cation/hydrogen antiporter
MLILEWTLMLLVAAVILTALARRWHVPYPSMLALLGAALVFLPGAPQVALQPDLALALFVAPVLLDAAFDTSPRDLRSNWKPIAGLVFIAVGVTTTTVAIVAKSLVSELPWAAAIALGAIVAPPDAAAATAVLREAKPPRRLLQILEGESLFNDATALLIYRYAVLAAMGGTLTFSSAAPTLALVVVGSIAAGCILAFVVSRILSRVEDVPIAVVLQFASTFGVWILAERLGLSGILTMVTYAITIARRAPMFTPARVRVPSYAVWDTAVFVLNALAFVLIGLQLAPILDRLSAAQLYTYGKVAIAILAVVVLTRIAWVMISTTIARWRAARLSARGKALRSAPPTLQDTAIVSWCGMRGIVTVAAALALPHGAQPFPGRDFILLAAFTVVLGTLVIQGLTLRPLLRWLDQREEDPVEKEVESARGAALQAALASIDGDSSSAADALRAEYRELWPAEESGTSASNTPNLQALRRQAVRAARNALVALRRDGTIGDDAFHRVEEELDRAELYAESVRGPVSAQS